MSKRGAGMLIGLKFRTPKSLAGKNILDIWRKEEQKFQNDGDKLLLLNSLRIASEYQMRKGSAGRKQFVRELYRLPGVSELTAVAFFESGTTSTKNAIRNLKTTDINDIFADISSMKHLSLMEAAEIYFSLASAQFMLMYNTDQSMPSIPGPWGKIDGP